MKVSIIGVGAIGGYVFTKLSSLNNYDLQCVVSPKSALLGGGELYLHTPETKISAPLKRVTSNYSQIDGELIFITTKSTQNPEVFPLLQHIKNRTVVVIQNGIGNEPHLAQFLHKSNTIIGATTNIKVTKELRGKQVTLHNKFNNLNYALYQSGSESIALEPLFSQLFVEVNQRDSVYQARFPKLLVNTSCNLASIIHDACMQTLSLSSEPRKLIENIAQEVTRVAHAYHVDIAPETIPRLLNKLSTPSFKGVYFSMKEDFDAGREMEIETIFYNFVALANMAEVQIPKMKTSLETVLSMIKQRDQQLEPCT